MGNSMRVVNFKVNLPPLDLNTHRVKVPEETFGAIQIARPIDQGAEGTRMVTYRKSDVSVRCNRVKRTTEGVYAQKFKYSRNMGPIALNVGDKILAVNSIPVVSSKHFHALIEQSSDIVNLLVQGEICGVAFKKHPTRNVGLCVEDLLNPFQATKGNVGVKVVEVQTD